MTVIEVFADVGCPFTHVGLRRFVERRTAAGRDDVHLRVRAWPLELVNGHRLDAAMVAEEVDALRTQVAPDLFRRFHESVLPKTSLPALGLAGAAYEHDVELGEDVSLLLRDLLFERGVDIADPEVLRDVAADAGLAVPRNHDAVLGDHAAGIERGVVGSPHFFTPHGGFFCPSLDIQRDDAGNLHIATDPAAFDRFLDACFAPAPAPARAS